MGFGFVLPRPVILSDFERSKRNGRLSLRQLSCFMCEGHINKFQNNDGLLNFQM